MEMMEKNSRRQILKFLSILAVFSAIVAIRFFDHEINPQGTTVFAFSYKYGFISRGFMGTVLQVLDTLLPWNLMCFDFIYLLSKLATLTCYFFLFAFFYVSLRRCRKEDFLRQQMLIVFLCVFAIPMFVTTENFGRLDTYLTILMLIAMISFVEERWEWLCVPLSIVGTLIHHGFVFMYLNMSLVFLFYKLICAPERRRKIYYGILFALTFLLPSCLFLYFEFFSHVNGAEIYDTVVAEAKALSASGIDYSQSLVNHEILGEGVFMDEWYFHKLNYAETLEFAILFLPYIILGIRFCRKLYKKACGRREKLCMLALVLGAWTVLPEMILKVDYGRYMFSLVFYYLAVMIILLARRDTRASSVLSEIKEGVKANMLAPALLIAYPMAMMPFLDVYISNISHMFVRLFGLQ